MIPIEVPHFKYLTYFNIMLQLDKSSTFSVHICKPATKYFSTRGLEVRLVHQRKDANEVFAEADFEHSIENRCHLIAVTGTYGGAFESVLT